MSGLYLPISLPDIFFGCALVDSKDLCIPLSAVVFNSSEMAWEMITVEVDIRLRHWTENLAAEAGNKRKKERHTVGGSLWGRESVERQTGGCLKEKKIHRSFSADLRPSLFFSLPLRLLSP